ncbi:hypothetical protein [Streptacidiphilus sp. MAP5-3]|uniref:hypothetical protein n=1 Tax=unclassified Streptacidiphilus TaxID=2643834 RepID=UPI003514FCAF
MSSIDAHTPLSRLAKRMHVDFVDLDREMARLCRAWGIQRVIAQGGARGPEITQAAVTALHQALGIRPSTARRTTPKESRA